MTTRTPARASPSAIALPIPLLPPVTIATLSYNGIALPSTAGQSALPAYYHVGARLVIPLQYRQASVIA